MNVFVLVFIFVVCMFLLVFFLFIEFDFVDNYSIKRFYNKYTSGDFEKAIHILNFHCFISLHIFEKTRIPLREVLEKFDNYFSRCKNESDDIMIVEYRNIAVHYCKKLRPDILTDVANYLINNRKGESTADYLEDVLSDEKYDKTLEKYKEEHKKKKKE